MRELPLLGCRLDEAALEAQLGRYRELAAHVETARRRPAEVVVDFGRGVDRELLAQTVATERGCCGFLAIDLTGDRLRIGAGEPAQEPALAAIADALGA